MRRSSAGGLGGLLVLWLCLGIACSPESTPTQLLVVVDSDLSLDANSQDGLKTIQVTLLQADNSQEIVPPRLLSVSATPQSSSEYVLPLSFALTPSGVADGELFRVVVTGQNYRGEDIAERQVVTAFRTGAALRLDLFLAATCLHELCRADGQRASSTCDPDTGFCGQVPELIDLPKAVGSAVSGYERPQSRADGGDVVQGDSGAAKKCETQSACDDGLYCNGSEECDPGSVKANSFGCVAGMASSCGAAQTCDEASDRCTSCAMVPDGDRDGVDALACGGTDCNDGDPAIAPNHSEVCDGKDNDCDEVTDMRAGASVCSVAVDGGVDAAVGNTGTPEAGAADAGVNRVDGGSDGGAVDAARADAAPSDAGMEASAPDASVTLVSGCTMGSKQACSSFINAWGAEVPMGSYGCVMESNVGQGFEVAVNADDTTAGCAGFASVLGLTEALGDKVLALGSLDLRLHTVYRPAKWVSGERYPLVVWGNGTCMQPETYGGHLRSLASQGFIVVAPNSRYVGTGDAMRYALDFAVAANGDTQSPYHGRIDTTKIGAMGHAQGAMTTVQLASDSRIQAVMLFSGGSTAPKPFLGVSGDSDLLTSLSTYQTDVNAAPKGAYLFFHMIPSTSGTFGGYFTLVAQPNRVTGATNAWWKYLLNNDATARTWFVGTSCTLCGHASDYEFGQKGL